MSAASEPAFYDIGGPVLEVRSDRPGDLAGLDTLLGGCRTGTVAQPAFRIEVRETPTLDENPAGAVAFDGEVPVDGRCRLIQDGPRLHMVFPGRQTLLVDNAAARAEIRVLPEAKTLWTAWMLALDAALDADGQSMLHMAGLTLPGREGTVLIHAPSGTGKTTTSLALASQGFGLCADDVMVLRPAKLDAWGLPRFVKIHRKTAAMVPVVAPSLGDKWDRNDEQAVPLDKLRAILPVEAPRPRPVLALLHLARSADGRTRLAALPKTEAMVALAADNVRTGLTGLLPLQQRRFAAIAALVSRTPTFTLEVGHVPQDAAAAILSEIGKG